MSIPTITETRQYLTFKLGDEVFAVDVANVREIFDFITVTSMPRAPDYMRGVINLRGSVVPVIDMRLKFGMTKTEKTVHTCIVVVDVALDNDTVVLGAIADSVQEVIELEPDQIESTPKIGTTLNNDFIKGMGKRDSRFIMILDIDKVFSADEQQAVINASLGRG